jgi:signal transduction histidine kinase
MNNSGKLAVERVTPASFPVAARSAYLVGYLVLIALFTTVVLWRDRSRTFVSIEDMIDLLIIKDHGSLALVSEFEHLCRSTERLHDRDTVKPAEYAAFEKQMLNLRRIYQQPLRRIARYMSSLPSEYPDHKRLRSVANRFLTNLDELEKEGVDQSTLAARGPQIIGEITEILIRTNKFVREFTLAHSAEMRIVGEFVMEGKREQLEKSGIKVEWKLEWPAEQRAWGQPAQYVVLIENLISNAVEAMKDVVQPRLAVRMLDSWNLLALEVEDNACGIPPDARDRIFEIGYSSKPGGTGIGLSESKRIIERYRGALRLIRSEPGAGSLFRAEFVKVKLEDERDDRTDAKLSKAVNR